MNLQTNLVHGKAFLLGPRVAVTSAHVIQDSPKVGIGRFDGLWESSVLKLSERDDVAVLGLERCVKERETDWQSPSAYPSINEDQMRHGDSVGILGYFSRQFENSTQTFMRSMLTAGVVSFISAQHKDTTRWAIHGAFVEPGFSGGPAFSPDGKIVGVVTGCEGTASQTHIQAPLEFPLVSPLLPYRDFVGEALAKYA